MSKRRPKVTHHLFLPDTHWWEEGTWNVLLRKDARADRDYTNTRIVSRAEEVCTLLPSLPSGVTWWRKVWHKGRYRADAYDMKTVWAELERRSR